MKIYNSRGLTRIFPHALSGQRFWSLFFVVMALLLFFYSSFSEKKLQTLRMATLDVVAPALQVVNTPVQKASDYVRAVTGLAELQNENARLRQENAKLREWYQTAMTLRTENESLQKLLNIKLPPRQNFITAQIVADSGNSYVKTLLVLAGKHDGVTKGNAVLAGEGIIGRIIETGGKISRVLLMTDINSRIPVLVEGVDIHAIIAGNNDKYPGLVHLPKDVKITKGSRVITSGYGGVFPYGLPVGTLDMNETGEWFVTPYTRMDNLTFVRIVGSKGDYRLQEARF